MSEKGKYGLIKLTVPSLNALQLMFCQYYLGFNLLDDIDINKQVRGVYTRGSMKITCFKHCSEPVKIYCLNPIVAVCIYSIVLSCGVILVSLFFRKLKT